MRAALAAAAAALVLAAGCGDDGAVSSARARCADADRASVPLLAEPAAEPSSQEQVCRLATIYSNVVLAPEWDDAASRLRAIDPDLGIWERRTLLLSCAGCHSAGLDLDEVRDDHPDWVLHDADGREVHVAGHPGQVLMDFGDPEYQAAWEDAVDHQLASAGWTGVLIEDARNDLPLSGDPLDPRTGQPMTDADRARYLAEALALVRGALKTDGFSLVANNDPPQVVDEAQIGSTDAVMAEGLLGGFAARRGAAWQQLFDYYRAAGDRHVGSWVSDAGEPDADSLFGLASYLLVAGPLSSYGPPKNPADPLYAIELGAPTDDATAVGGAWMRTFEHGAVAVAPGDEAASVRLPDGRQVSLPAGGAVIQSPAGVLQGP